MISTSRSLSIASSTIVLVVFLVACGSESQEPTPSVPAASGNVSQTALKASPTSAETDPIPTPPGGVPTAQPPSVSSFDTDGDGFMTNTELHNALIETESQYPLPSGYSLNIDQLYAAIASSHPANAKHENLAEHTILGRLHMCAWGRTWLDAHMRGDRQTMDTAMHQLQTVTLGRPNGTGTRDRFEEIFNLAKLGQSSDLNSLIEANCTWEEFETTPTAEAKNH